MRDEALPIQRRTYHRRFYAHREPYPLQIVGRNKTVAFACGNCGSVHAKWWGDRSHPDGAYIAALECCRRPAHCVSCGGERRKEQSTKCDTCHRRDEYIRTRNAIRKAKRIEDTGDPVWSDWGNGEWGDGYSSCLAAHLQAWEDDNEEGVLPPSFVCATYPQTPQVNIEHIFESLCEDQHENFEIDDLPWVDTLEKAVAAFNAQQRPCSYMLDMSRVIVLDAARFERYLSEDHNGYPDIKYNAGDEPTKARLKPSPGELVEQSANSI